MAEEQETKQQDALDTMNRRGFLGRAALAAPFVLAGAWLVKGLDRREPAAEPAPRTEAGKGQVPRRKLGKTGETVSALGIGGWHLGAAASDAEAKRIIDEALDAGVNFMDNAYDYHNGGSEERLGRMLKGRRDKAFVMTKVCTHSDGDAKAAMRQLEESLRRLQTDHLDLWQIHEVIRPDQPGNHMRAGGTHEALLQAKKEGKVRFIGFTGHREPDLLLKMLSYDFPWDTCQLPLNPIDFNFRSFEKQVLPVLRRKGLGIIGMKALAGTGEPVRNGVYTAAEGIRYAMSLPVATTISGMDSLERLRENVAIARAFRPMSPKEMQDLRARCAEKAANGRFEWYKR